MAKVDKIRTLRKALLRGAQYAAVAATAIQTVPVPDTVGIDQKATVVFIIGLVGAIAKGIHNYKKTKDRAPFLGSASGLVLLIMAGLIAGCVTTTAPDGSTVVSVDSRTLETAWSIYEATLDRKQTLQAERDAAQAADRARLDAELRALEPQLQAAWLAAMGLAD